MARKIGCMCCGSRSGLRSPIYVKGLDGMYVMILCESCFLSIAKEA